MTSRTVTLKEVSGGGSYGFVASASTSPLGQKFLRTTDIVGGIVDWNNVPYCSISESQLEKFRLNHDDIVISRTGANAGVNALVLNPPEGAVFAGYLVRFRVDNKIADPKFVAYVLRSQYWRSFVEAHRTGSAQPQLNAQIMGSFEFDLPSMPTQRAISQLLTSLDEKIQSNIRLSATLESLAHSFFKSWFIDFDPVQAKARGEQPGSMDAEIAALFPDSFEESELGLIPSGWKVGSVSDLCSRVVNGSTPSRSNRDFWEHGDVPWFKTGELADNFLIDSSESISGMAVNQTSVKVLPKGSVLMAIYAAPTVGRLGILTSDAAFNQACTGMVPLEEVGSGFLYLKLKESRNYFNSLAIGAAQQNISKGVVEECPVILPDLSVFAAFNKLVGPMFSMIERQTFQNANLASIRDTLLPRLISGELEIPDELLGD